MSKTLRASLLAAAMVLFVAQPLSYSAELLKR